MFKELKKIIEEELSGRQAFRYADRIAQYHRIQASPGYREAAHEVMKLLKRDGVDAELVSYPAQFGERFLSHHSFKEWSCHSAELWIETPERKRIARFQEEEISLVQRSISTPEEGLKAELVVIENAEDETSYMGCNLEGKMALVRGDQFIIHALAVEKYKCAGLIFDNLAEFKPIRTRLDLPDTRQYTSYWWHHDEEVKSFGFVVSPRIGEELRNLARKGTVHLKATVKTDLQDGHFQNIEYFIPGKKDQEILLVSHLCHPFPGGQDNASGPGTLMEVMRTITHLIKDGKLPQPELGIRFLMMPEMTGTAAYFHQHQDRISKTIAALNLDMVGGDQTKGGGPLCIEQPPMAVPTFLDRFASKLFESTANNTTNFTGTSEYSTVHYVQTRFSGGSDHYIISDPTIGIPCPMLIQWPDKHYHTTSDSTNHLDENMMKLVGTVTALYSYSLANGQEEEWIAYTLQHIGTTGFHLNNAREWLVKDNPAKKEFHPAFSFYVQYEKDSLAQLEQYAKTRGFNSMSEKIQSLKNLIEKQAEIIAAIGDDGLSEKTVIKEKLHWTNNIYKRNFQGPIRTIDEIASLPVEERYRWLKETQYNIPMGYEDFILYWMDGKRTIQEVLDLTYFETGQLFPDYVSSLIELYIKLEVIQSVGEA
ncbi:DUF4910 domain-containing protein [Bacillus lacus]|uniref:DUF4910 domain-containing protein n=1 Tax=Metabacillus lacus TaxID=1983721 RepID=A0A7X2LZF5_9BACI|nr:DUF4910 domain-containing protein [Metabacillus lacus]MRX73371.1 DUF4910 domain-containing protein [Metabacillus lacus]